MRSETTPRPKGRNGARAGFDFVVFSDDWGRHPSSSQHLFRHIAPGNRVLWVETIGLRTPRLTLYDLRRIEEKIRGWLPWSRRSEGRGDEGWWAPVPDGLVRLSPPMHPFYGSPVGAFVNDVLLRWKIRATLDRLGMQAPLLLTTVPNVAGLVGQLGERASVYYCVDDFALWGGYAGDVIRGMEQQLLSKVDALVVTARKLADRALGRTIPLLTLPHGVDVEHFAAGGPEPGPLARIPRPRLLFLGLYDDRVAVDLLDDVARRRPDWQLIFVGRRTARRSGLDQRKNVFVFPQVPYAQVPAWLAAAEVLMIPYVRNEQTDTINPLKLREFLATGVPIVSTALPEVVSAAGDLVPTADDAEGFIVATEEAMSRRGEAALRRERVATDGWAQRAETLLHFLQPLISHPV